VSTEPLHGSSTYAVGGQCTWVELRGEPEVRIALSDSRCDRPQHLEPVVHRDVWQHCGPLLDRRDLLLPITPARHSRARGGALGPR